MEEFSSSLVNGSLTYSSIGVFSIVRVLFGYCYSSDSGGAILLVCKNAKIGVFSSAFDHCTAAVYGGGIFIDMVKYLVVKTSCFYSCIATHGPGFNAYANSETSNTYFNLSDEISFSLVKGASQYYGSTNSLWSSSNSTGSQTSDRAAGIRARFGNSNKLISFSQISSSNGPCFLSFDPPSANSPSIEFLNVINCTCTSAWMEFMTSAVYLTINSCIFMGITQIVSFKSTSSLSTITMNRCIMSSSYVSSHFSKATLNSCSFSYSSITKHNLKLHDTYECWHSEGHKCTVSYISTKQVFPIIFMQFLLCIC